MSSFTDAPTRPVHQECTHTTHRGQAKGRGSMSIDTITTADLVLGVAPACSRCHQPDRRGLTGWLGLSLCGLCLLMAKARRAVQS